VNRPAGQEELGLAPVQYGGLFSENFLRTRLPEWPEFEQLDCGELLTQVRAIWEREGPTLSEANEAQVEEHFVRIPTPGSGAGLRSGRRQAA
jgi:hypothetical protein